MIDSILRQVQGWVKLKGNSDNTKIGNVGDALKVTQSSVPGAYPAVPNTITHDSSRTSTTLNNGASYTQVYSYVGSGSFFSLTVGADDKRVIVAIEIDDVVGITFDLQTLETLYPNFHNNGAIRYDKVGRVFTFNPLYPIQFNSKLRILGKGNDDASNKAISAYSALLIKD